MTEPSTGGIHPFCAHGVRGGADDAALLGHKGAHLAQMMQLGLPVPPGFTLDVPFCNRLRSGDMTDADRDALGVALAHLRQDHAARFHQAPGAPPLLLAVRGSTRRALPGLLPALTNVGISRRLIAESAEQGADAAFLWDCYTRFLQGYGVLVAGLAHEDFDYVRADFLEDSGFSADEPLPAKAAAALAGRFEEVYAEYGAELPPEDPLAQLQAVATAIAGAWDAPVVRAERAVLRVPDGWGMAITVQAMVFGNLDDHSASGNVITRDPVSGEKRLSGEYLPRAQGEEVVAGLRTLWPVTEEERRRSGLDTPSLERAHPGAYAALLKAAATLERHYKRAQHIEFVIECGHLWLVQHFAARLGPEAALRTAVDMVREGLIDREQALLAVDPYQLEKLLHPVLERRAGQAVLAHGLGASPGAASGEVAIDAEEAQRLAAAGRPVILVRPETTPEDIPALQGVRGVLTARGGLTSHAAVIARGLGVPCVAGVGVMEVDASAGTVRLGGNEVRVGEWITIDGASGEVFRGRMPTRQPELSRAFDTLLSWADEVRTLGVRANADTPRDAETARAFGAEGIGLCRTEHMFFGSELLTTLQELILSPQTPRRAAVLEELAAAHAEDFRALFAIMAGKPVAVRLLDPPVHEFLPRAQAEMEALAERLGVPVERLAARVAALKEYNPMLGHRGARLLLTLPELLVMQVRAMFEAMRGLMAEGAAPARLEIMAPFIMAPSEMARMRRQVTELAAEFTQAHGMDFPWSLGCMIELPSACMLADALARNAEFLSFGTNDLTQTVLGLSRDDAGRFLHVYLENGLLERDPFVTLDEEAVGPFIRMAVERGRAGRPGLQAGACGEHGGDPRSIMLLTQCGLDYVSCSPFRVPIARLAAAQAALRTG